MNTVVVKESGTVAVTRDATRVVAVRSPGPQGPVATWENLGGKPTTLAGFGITDGTPSSHMGAGGTAHANAVAGGEAGFMTGADKTKLDGVAISATANSSDSILLLRENHTGSQTASTISDFTATVRATVLTGLSLAASTTVDATHTVLQGIGFLQKQISDLVTTVGDSTTQFRGLAVTQTVLEGPIDSSGYASFGGSTGTATLTVTGTIKPAVAAGGDLSYVGSITNPVFTSPAGSGTGFLMLSVTAAGVVTAFVRSLEPVYQWGGSYSITNGQPTFNIQEMTMKVGNGSDAVQVFEVCIGECPFTDGVWSGTPTYYALRGRYDSGWFAVTTATLYVKNHNIGTAGKVQHDITIADDAAGTSDRILANAIAGGNGYYQRNSTTPRNQIDIQTGGSNVGYSTSGTLTGIASAYYRINSNRSF